MVRTRSQKGDMTDRLPPESSLDSDTDAPEEITLASSRKKAAQDRKQQKESIQGKKQIQKEKNRQRAEDKKNKPSEPPLQAEHAGPEQEQQLDLLPDEILQAVVAAEDDDNYSSEGDEEQNDRRIVQRRIVTEQLRQGLKKSKRRAFLETQQVTAGPVTVKVLHSQPGAMAYNQTADPKMTAQATSFLHQNLYGRHKRSKEMLRPATLPSSNKKQKFVYFS